LFSVIWWFSYLWYSINELICWYSLNYDWHESVICPTNLWRRWAFDEDGPSMRQTEATSMDVCLDHWPNCHHISL